MSRILRPALDLSRVHFERVKRGIRVSGTWLREGNQVQPCLVLTPANRLPVPGQCVPVVVPLNEAWRYALQRDAGGDMIGDPIHAGTSINEWLVKGYLPGSPLDKRAHLAVLDAINDNIRDLFAMPPRPPAASLHRVDIGEVTITDKSTGKTHTKEISNNV